MNIELTPDQIKNFKAALLAAFDRGGLEQVCLYGLGVHWQTVVREGNLDQQVNDLVVYANQNDQVRELLTTARGQNPRNPRLIRFEQDLLAGGFDQAPTPPPPPLAYQPPIDLRPDEQDSLKSMEALLFANYDTRLPFTFVERAVRTARSIARIAVARCFGGQPDGLRMYGTGWLIAPGLLITNHHVIDARDRRSPPQGRGELPAAPADFRLQAEYAVATFDYYSGEEPDANAPELRQGKLLAADARLDFALIDYGDTQAIGDRSPLKVVPRPPLLARGERLNIVQHPRGKYLRYAIRNNFYVRLGKEPHHLLYQTDTEPGASGSPVCSDQWHVVGLHHASVQVEKQIVPQEVLQGQPQPVTLLNEAISLAAILDSLPPELRQRIAAAQTSLS